jgi:hypothetical protein
MGDGPVEPTFAQPFWFLVFSLDDQSLHHLLVIVIKRQPAAQQRVEDDSE